MNKFDDRISMYLIYYNQVIKTRLRHKISFKVLTLLLDRMGYGVVFSHMVRLEKRPSEKLIKKLVLHYERYSAWTKFKLWWVAGQYFKYKKDWWRKEPDVAK